ncbi:MAG TPA: 23S rRNA (pseudouridine(1915)-N(3))-methyltransferase RlmH [Pyrinomonadaceae bacterium]|nr:23S rRNA (pseudouridine(1915)-N(3))-methyltransferase RlmH [Pyrinomonadaceae bacterium]
MKLRLVWTGKTKDAHLRALADGYLKRLNHFTRCEVTELRESASADSKAGIDKDSKRISDALQSATLVVLLDSEGSEWTSQQLAAELQRWENRGTKEVAFVIGGPGGVSRQLIEQADKRWSLTRLTLAHEMARVVVLEQLYRAYTIMHGLPYQK